MLLGSSVMLFVRTAIKLVASGRMFSWVNPNEWPISWQTCARLRLETVTICGLVLPDDEVKKVGVVGEKNPVRLIGVRDELDVRGQFPFAQAIEVGICLRGGKGIREFIRHDAAGPRDIRWRNAGVKIAAAGGERRK